MKSGYVISLISEIISGVNFKENSLEWTMFSKILKIGNAKKKTVKIIKLIQPPPQV